MCDARRVTESGLPPADVVETYLRCRLEDAVVDEDGGPEVFRAQVAAVRALGALPDDAAARLAHDAPRALRRLEHHHDHDRPADGPPAVIACPTVVEQPWGTFVLTHVVAHPHQTVLGAFGTVRDHDALAAGRAGHGHRHGHAGPGFPDTIDVDTGTGVQQAHFSGGAGSSGFSGAYTADPPLPPGAASITVLGRAVPLTGRGTREFRVDPLAGLSAAQRAARHLELVAAREHWYEQDPAAAARGVFADLGVAVPDAGPAVPGRAPGPPRPRRRGPRGRDAALRWIPIGAVTPLDDGWLALIAVLDRDGETGLAFVGGTVDQHGGQPLWRTTVSDDRGRTLPTSVRDSGSDGEQFHAMVALDRPPAADATALSVAVDLLTHRVEVDVPLAWQGPA